MTARTRTAALVVCFAAWATMLGLAANPASATAYRYWTYWTGAGSTWTFSQVGPASTVPKDGTVQGWRFALSTGVRGETEEPRISPAAAFDQFCSGTAARAGSKRVAVIFDFGDPSDAPPGQAPPPARGVCVQAPSDAVGSTILREAADVRVEGGLVCAIGGYPVGECAPAVATPSPRASASASPDRRSSANDRSPGGGQGKDAPSDGSGGSTTDQGNGGAGSGDTGGTSAGSTGTKDGDAGTTSSSPTASAKADPSPASTAPASADPVVPVATTSATPSPTPVEFAAEDAHSPTQPTQWWPLMVGLAVLLALVGWIVWRRRSHQRA
jgi:hypothetical protein